MNFGNLLKTMRKHRGLTQIQCAAHLEIAVGTLITWERGEVDPGRLKRRGAVLCLRGIPCCNPADAALEPDPESVE